MPPSPDRALPRASHLSRRALLAGSAATGTTAALAARPARRAAAQATPAAGAPLPAAVRAVMAKPRYADAVWSFLVADLDSGETLLAHEPDRLALTGSCRKLYSVGLALRQLGPDARATTAVHRTGEVDPAGTLAGDLVLLAAGDLTFGGRRLPGDEIEFTSFDHNDANNLGTAILTPQDPLAALDDLAAQVRAAGIAEVAGDVIVDDRRFQSFRVPNQNLLVTPIMVNENMVDLTALPTTPGSPAGVGHRPRSAAFAVDAAVGTGPAGSDDTVALSDDGHAVCVGTPGCAGTLTGDLPADYRAPLSGSPEWVRTFRIEDPAAYARTAFVEALGRAGVNVAAAPVAPNPASKLPAADALTEGTQVAAYVSPPYAQEARLILKVSLNLGANLALMKHGLAHGARTVDAALAAEREALVGDLGLDPAGFDFPTNGSGSPDSRATPRATVNLLAAMAASPVAAPYRAALPILGVDGSLAGTGTTLPARGHVLAKTGTTLGEGQLVAQNLAGYIDAKSGRRLAFALFLNDAGPVQAIEDVTDVFEDEAVVTSAFWEAF